MTAIDYRPRATTYNGIRMRSRLEASFAQWLDSLSLEWEYEPMCYANETGQYLPDFIVKNVNVLFDEPDIKDLVIEVKPSNWPTKESVQKLADRMRIVPAEVAGMIIVAVQDQGLFCLNAVHGDEYSPLSVSFVGTAQPPWLVFDCFIRHWRWQGE